MKPSGTRPARRLGWLARLAAAAGLLAAAAFAARPAPQAAPAAITWPTIFLTLVDNGFTQPLYVAGPPDGSGRLFVVEQPGAIKIIQNGDTLATPFLDLSATGADRVRNTGNEEGLLSVAFPPGFPNGDQAHFYVYYTSEEGSLDGDNVVARYQLASPNVADPNSEQIVIAFEHPGESNHNGGQLQFGPGDGYLYIGTGDGGGGDDPGENGQDPNEYLGKILRIDVETSNPITYTVPATNPLVGVAGLDEIWALGMRNPWRFSFDRVSHDLYIGDVGQGDWEEVDHQPAASDGGENYGWDCYEGFVDNELTGCGPAGNYTFPAITYSHSFGCSVTGGYVYRGSLYSRLYGLYFYADYCRGTLWGMKFDGAAWQTQMLLDTTHLITGFGEDEHGNLYVAARSGSVYLLKEETVYLPLVLK